MAGYPCSTCSHPLQYVEGYGQWYCTHCRRYISPGKKDEFSKFFDDIGSGVNGLLGEDKYMCPSCNSKIAWVEQYKRWYCSICMRYL